METFNHRHERYVETASSGITILKVITEFSAKDRLINFEDVVKRYNEKITNVHFDHHDLDSLRKILCCEYELRIKRQQCTKSNYFDNSFFDDLQEIVLRNSHDGEVFTLLLDIMVLEMVLFCDSSQIKSFFHASSNADRSTSYKIISGLIDSLYLHSYVHKVERGHQTGFNEISTIVTNIFKSSLHDINNTEWGLLMSILTKLIETFDGNEVVPYMWSLIMNKDTFLDYQERQLTLLTITLDNILSVAEELNATFCCDPELWNLICCGLTSKVEEQRKQALYIMRKVIDFMEKQSCMTIVNSIPFINCRRNDQRKSARELKTQFFLIFECLEEKQAHLVLPVLAHLDQLIQGSVDHLECGNCFDISLVRCIYQRILRHTSNAVIKIGITSLLKMNPKIFDEQFIVMLLKSLNNTYLYNNPTMESLPEIVIELTSLFVKAEKSEVNLINQFICQASEICWSPIPLMYIIEALSIATDKLECIKSNIWTKCEHEAIRKIIAANIKRQPKPLQRLLEFNICKILTHFAIPLWNLESITRILSSFPSKERLLKESIREMIVKYLENNLKEDSAKFVSSYCRALIFDSAEDEIDTSSFALMIILLHRSKNILDSNSGCINALRNIFDRILRTDIRPYADTISSIKILEVVAGIIKWKQHINSVCSIDEFLYPYISSTARFILKGFKQITAPESYTIAVKNIEIFDALLCDPVLVRLFDKFTDHKVFYDEAVTIIRHHDRIANVQYWKILQLLSRCKIHPPAVPDFFDLLLEQSQQGLNLMDRNDGENSGKIVSECYEQISQLLKECVEKFGTVRCTNLRLSSLRNFLEIGKEHVVPSVIQILEIWCLESPAEMANNRDVVLMVDMAWKLIWDLKKSDLYWVSLDRLISLMTSPAFLKIEDCRSTALKHIEILVAKGENIPALRHLLIIKMSDLGLTDPHFLFFNPLLSCLFHSNVGQMDKQIEMQAYHYAMKYHKVDCLQRDTISKNNNGIVYIDVIFRTQCVLLMFQLWKNLTPPNRITFIEALISVLKSLKGKRHFGDSSLHRMKHRVMQLLLLVQSDCDDSLLPKMMHEAICDLIVTESNQPSVRVMQEWLLIRIYKDNPMIIDLVWQFLDEGIEKRPASVTSIAMVVYHVSRLLPRQQQITYARKAVRKLLPCCFSQLFVVRLHCQVILSKIIAMIDAEKNAEYLLIQEAVHESLRLGNLKNNSLKLSEDFFTLFDPVKDFNLQTIFYELPRLLNMSMDEWISGEVFECVMSPTSLSKLFGFKTGIKMPQQGCNDAKSKIEDIQDAPNNVQKKVIPWTPMIPGVDEASYGATLRKNALADGSGMIVVASLIEGMPNLGGLSRTAEIFCARELVLASIKHTENKEFQALSVSSEKWVTLTEVKPSEVQNYLLEKKSMGWTLVAAEQTANSISLVDMDFDKKTVLVLGNERSGIPANLIPLMDVCLEIPQAGVVRSLNVHVTGAICMFHYAKQHIFKNN